MYSCCSSSNPTAVAPVSCLPVHVVRNVPPPWLAAVATRLSAQCDEAVNSVENALDAVSSLPLVTQGTLLFSRPLYCKRRRCMSLLRWTLVYELVFGGPVGALVKHFPQRGLSSLLERDGHT